MNSLDPKPTKPLKRLVCILSRLQSRALHESYIRILIHAIQYQRANNKLAIEAFNYLYSSSDRKPQLARSLEHGIPPQETTLRSDEIQKTKKRLSVYVDDELVASTPSKSISEEQPIITTPFVLELGYSNDFYNYETPNFKQSIINFNRHNRLRPNYIYDQRLLATAFQAIYQNFIDNRKIKRAFFNELVRNSEDAKFRNFKAYHYKIFCLQKKALEAMKKYSQRRKNLKEFQKQRETLFLRKILFSWVQQ